MIDAERQASALLELMAQQRAAFPRADGESIRQDAVRLGTALNALLINPDAPPLPAQTLARLQLALDAHARLLSTAGARVERGLNALGLLEIPAVAHSRGRFAGASAGLGQARNTA